MLLGHVTARASDSMFYPLTLCALKIVFMIMIYNYFEVVKFSNFQLLYNSLTR